MNSRYFLQPSRLTFCLLFQPISKSSPKPVEVTKPASPAAQTSPESPKQPPKPTTEPPKPQSEPEKILVGDKTIEAATEAVDFAMDSSLQFIPSTISADIRAVNISAVNTSAANKLLSTRKRNTRMSLKTLPETPQKHLPKSQ